MVGKRPKYGSAIGKVLARVRWPVLATWIAAMVVSSAFWAKTAQYCIQI